MASWGSELLKAAEKLEAAAEKLERASGGPGGGAPSLAQAMAARGGGPGGGAGIGAMVGGLSGGRSFLAAAGPAGMALAGAGLAYGAAEGAAGFLGPAARAYAATGSSQAFASGVTGSLLDAAASNPITAYLTADQQVARGTAQRAGQATSQITESLAAIGVSVSDEDRRQLYKVNEAIENRVTEERGKVEAIANSAEALQGAKPKGAGENWDRVISILSSIESTVRGLRGGG